MEAIRIERSPADVLRLAVAVVALLFVVVLDRIFGEELVAFGDELLGGLAAVPQWIVDVVVIGTRVLAGVVVVALLVRSVRSGGLRMLATVAVAAGLAIGVTWLGDQILDEPADAPAGAPVEIEVRVGPLADGTFPTAAGLAAVTAAVTAAAPWLSRRWRQTGWIVVIGAATVRALATPVSFDTPRALAVGWATGAAALVALGAPSRRPMRPAVIAGLRRVGLDVAALEPASVDARGSTPYIGLASDGTPLFVKVLGDDERSADLLFRTYRKLTAHDFGDERPFSSLRRAVEHEALVALAARDAGIRTPRLMAYATAEPRGSVLAYESIRGTSLDRVHPTAVTDEVLGQVWRLLAALHRRGIAHRDLRLANVFLDDHGDAWLIDFGFAELAADDLLLATDVAELLASSSVAVGAERAVAAAADVVDPRTLRRAADRLRPWALSGATRTAHGRRPGLLDELRRSVLQVAAATP